MGLTEKRVRDAKPSARTRFEWDDAVKGFGLRVTPAGAKAYVLDYRADGQRRRMTLGEVGGLTLEQARNRANEFRQAARDGHDPLQAARARREAPTVAEAADRFLKEYIPRRLTLGRMAEATAMEYARQIERHIRPTLGARRVQDVTRRDIEWMLANAPEDKRKIAKGKTPKGAPIPPVSANRLLALCSRLFRLCEDWGWRPQNSNPARGVEKAVEEARDRTLTSSELSALGKALGGLDANPGAILAIRLAAMTGLRIGEVQAMRWEDVDMQGGRLVLPRTKTGRRVHTLPSAALILLAEAQQVGPFVIPGRSAEAPMNLRAIRRVFELACEKADIRDARLHDLRRTTMTQAAAMGVGAHLLRDMLGHKTTAMADRYIRNAGEPLTELRERVGAGMAAQMGGSTGEVVRARDTSR